MNLSKKTLMLKDSINYGAANYFSQGLGMITSVLLRRYLGPFQMGIWSILQVILSYCGYASFGTTKALARDYPFLRGKGDFEKADEIVNSTLTFTMAMSWIPAVLLSGYLILQGNKLTPVFRNGLAFLILFLFVQRFYDFLITLLRSEKRFGILGVLIMLNALGTFLVSLWIVSRWQLHGLYGGTFLVCLLCLAFIYRVRPYLFRPSFNVQKIGMELKLGIPLVLSSFLFELLRSTDKLLIAKKVGFDEVGFYSIAMMVSSYVLSAPMMFAHVWYPNLQEEYGMKESPEGIRNYLLVPVSVMAVLVPILSGLAFYFIPLIVELFLPKFIPGLTAMKIYLLGTFFVILGQFSENFLVTLNRYLITLPVLMISILVNFTGNWILLSHGGSIEGVALIASLSFMVYGIAAFFLASTHLMIREERIRYMARNLGAYVLLVVIAWLIDRWVRCPSSALCAILKCVIFLFSTSFFWLKVLRRLDFLNHLKRVFSGSRKPEGL